MTDDAQDPTPAERIEVQRRIAAPPAEIFAVLVDPEGHVEIDSSGMLMSATGDRVGAVGDSFVVHMDREALNDFPLGEYDVTVKIVRFEPDRQIAWKIEGQIKPQIGHVYGYLLEPEVPADPADPEADEAESSVATIVTSYYDWSEIHPDWRAAGIFPVLSEGALRATLGILARTVARRARASRDD
jgi:hypothetical protein